MSDAAWAPAAALEILRGRSAMLARVRAYFAAQEVREVHTPVLSVAAVSDPHIESVAASPARGGRRFLQTSPEYPMKRLLAAGFGDCYQVCPVFRDGEAGRQHNPEFTMLEWYRVDFGMAEIQHDVDRVLRVACADVRSLPPVRSVTYRDAIRDACGVDCRDATPAEVAAVLSGRGIVPADARDWDLDAWLDLLMGAVVGPALGHDGPLFVEDYPASQAALARLRTERDGSQVAERFELYLDGLELANGFRELGDAAEQRRRFERDLAVRGARGQPVNPLDANLLAALAHGLPDCAGVALGFDRLVMAAWRLPSLADAMAFPFERA
ncbi:MAG TPA: EF-P lysine aminoacylase EpmA [Steroidobacteraceae bacterium]|nr:EF-P lysine aminoacylase EpmA [Steroidobacteraceae bacterium]